MTNPISASPAPIEFVRLSQVDQADLLILLNDPALRRHMPLSTSDFDTQSLAEWVKAKEAMWTEHGYGPWAFLVDGKLAGWGGFQPEEGGGVDLALVLRPAYWGTGKAIFDQVVRRGLDEMNIHTFTVLLPPSRTNVRALSRLGFSRDGSVKIDGSEFIRYRLAQK